MSLRRKPGERRFQLVLAVRQDFQEASSVAISARLRPRQEQRTVKAREMTVSHFSGPVAECCEFVLLVSVVLRLVRALCRNRQIIRLIGSELRQFHAELVEMNP